MTTDLEAVAKERGIKYFLISFTDLFGVQRAKLVPASAIDGMAKAGAAFAGFATWLDMTPADPDLFAIPDPDSLIQSAVEARGRLARGRSLDERPAGRSCAAQRAEAADRRRGRHAATR